MEGRGQGVPLVESLWNAAAGLGQAGVTDGHSHQTAGAVVQSAAQNGGKQLLGLPLAARVEKVFPAPTAVLTTPGPKDAGQATASQADQRAQRLPYGASKGALLGEHGAPVGDNVEEGGQQSHRGSGRKPKVFLAVRRKRSPRATFLEREETRLSRSTATEKEVLIRASRSETGSGARAFLSTS